MQFAELVRLARTSIADEMREEHRRRVPGNDIERAGDNLQAAGMLDRVCGLEIVIAIESF